MTNKPIKSTYSILLMRDDCAVSTFRLRAFWFKAFIVVAFLLVCVCAVGTYGTYYYHGRYQAAASKRDSLQAELYATKVKLQERKNLAILPDGDDGDGRPYVTSSVQPYNPANSGASDAGSSAPDAAGSSDGAGSPSASETPGAATAAGALGAGSPSLPAIEAGGQAGTQTGGRPDPNDAQALLGLNGPVTAAGVEHDQAAAPDPDRQPVKVSNVATAFEAGNKLRVSFDIANQPQKGVLAGAYAISAITRQGGEIELTPVSRGSLTFRIERFRRMQVVMILPGDLKTEDIVSVKIAVRLSGLAPYGTIFPIQR